jgi:hypothetical protein
MRVTREGSQRSWPGHAISGGVVLLTLTAVALAAGCGAQPRPDGQSTERAGSTRPTSPAPPASPARPASPAAAQAAARQDPGTQPLSQAGPGWAIAEFSSGSPTVAGPVTLDLVDPSGRTYPLYSWASTMRPWNVLDWSGDRSRVLLVQADASPEVFGQLTLATGQLSTFTLPAGATVLGYTRPDGDNILVDDQDGLARYNLSGVLQQRLVTGSQYDSAISSPDGVTEVVNGSQGLELVSNTGGVIRQLPVPGGRGCAPVRWWNATTVLATCTPASPAYAPQVWLVPVTGARGTALTPVRTSGPDLGDLDAWELPGGLYVQALGACGTQFIGQQSATGTVQQVSVPGSSGDNRVVATAGSRLLVLEVSECTPSASLAWLDPATGAISNVLLAPAHRYGVMSVIPFNGDGTQPPPSHA